MLGGLEQNSKKYFNASIYFISVKNAMETIETQAFEIENERERERDRHRRKWQRINTHAHTEKSQTHTHNQLDCLIRVYSHLWNCVCLGRLLVAYEWVSLSLSLLKKLIIQIKSGIETENYCVCLKWACVCVSVLMSTHTQRTSNADRISIDKSFPSTFRFYLCRSGFAFIIK